LIKYLFLSYIVLTLLLFYEVNLMFKAKTQLEKQVAGIKTEIEKINNYEKQILDFEATY